MALNCQVGTLTQPGATGPQTYSLPANFDPKALILWAVPLAAAGTGVHALMGVGFAAGAVSCYAAFEADDNAATSDTYNQSGVNSVLSIMNGSTGAIDLAITFTQFHTGATSDFVLNWTNLHTTASVLVNYMVLGGSDITVARVGDWGATGSAQNVALSGGSGRPDLIFFFGTDTTIKDTLGNQGTLTFGFAKQGEAGRSLSFTSMDAQATAESAGQRIYNNRAFVQIDDDGATEDLMGQLDTVITNWPTDGFRVIYDASAPASIVTYYLALKLSASGTVTTGEGVAPIAGGLPVVQNLAHGAPPSGMMLLNTRQTGSNVADQSSADCGAMGIGAGDGTNEVWAGMTDDDGLATSNANNMRSSAKVIQNWDMSTTPAITSEADGSISGNDFALSWNDIEAASAWKYQWVTFGGAAAAAPPDVPKPYRRSFVPMMRAGTR